MSSSTSGLPAPWARQRGRVRDALGLALVASFTTWVALLSWKGFAVAWGSFMGPLLQVGVVVAVSGALLRWLRVPGPLIVLTQLVVVGAVVSLYVTGSPVPLGDSWVAMKVAFEGAWATAEQYAAPVPRGVPSIDPLVIAGGATCMLIVDVIVGTLRRAAFAGLPLLAIYSVPVSLLGGGVSWIVFGLAAIGFLLMLYLQESRQIARWGRPLGDEDAADPSGFGVSNGALRSSAGAIGAAATALAIVAPILTPTFGISLLDSGFGPGGGDQIKVQNPMVDLKRDLERGQDVPMIRVRTDDPDPNYLRVSVLNRLTDNEWSSGDRTAPTDQRAIGEMPEIQGLDPSVPVESYDYSVQISDDFISTWLPTQAPISRIEAAGDWRYDISTMDFMAFDEGLTTRSMTYTMTAVIADLSAQELAASGAATDLAGTQLTELPPGLPSVVRQMATDLTREAPTRFQKAVALQNFFREDGDFEYTLDRPAGNGSDTLVAFLDESSPEGRRGYCEQFASAMAVMARTLGIPTRVAIGFLEPDRVGPDTYVYSAHDFHAWPELYFPGSGWVRFEPTPAARAANTPSYTQYQFPEQPESELPSTGVASEGVANRPELTDPKDQDPQATDDAKAGGIVVPWRTLGLGAVLLVVVAAALLAPQLVRRRRRDGRLSGGPEPVWLELRDTVLDLGLTWPARRSPRETGERLAHYLGPPNGTETSRRPRHGPGVSPEAERALDRITLTLEQQRYARPGTQEAAMLKADAEAVVSALLGGVAPRTRRLAAWMPRSLLVSRRLPKHSHPKGTEEFADLKAVDRVGS